MVVGRRTAEVPTTDRSRSAANIPAATIFYVTSERVWDEASSLAALAAQGDRSALARMIALTQRDVWRYVAFHAHPRDADDLTQDTFLRAIGSLPSFQGRSSVRTWLLVIARRVVIDHLRKRSSRPRIAATENWQALADGEQTDTLPFTELVELDLLLAGLTSERREALILTQVLGLGYEEAAEICRCPVGTIRSRVARARADLIRLSAEDAGHAAR
ncbi:sigma-70 family RNA polymerase sigma factor [Nakamurella silvestris]|nr:sigma-70 family RNA polymerase sigma factor [Nakamurella silvestris]